MSSVTSKTGSSGQEDGVRQAREDYRKKEAELIKKHNKEIRELNERYVGELDRKDRIHSNAMGDARKRSQESLTVRDARYKKEMEDLRKMHTKQLEKLMSDNGQRIEAQREASRLEVKQASAGKEDRVKGLHEQYNRQLSEEQQKFAESLENLREDQRETTIKERTDAEKAHRREKEAMRDSYEDTTMELKNQNAELRESTAQRLRQQEVRHMQNKMRAEKAHMDNVNRLENNHGTIQEITREGYEQSLGDVRNKMARARQRDAEAQNEINSEFKSDVNNRIESQVNRLERDLAQARQTNVLAQTQEQKKAQTQIGNMRDAYQTKFDYLEKARQDTLRQSNEINAQNIRQVRSEADKQMADNSRYYRGQMEQENFRNRAALESTEKDFAIRNEYQREMADARIDNIRGEAINNELKLRDNFKANVDILKSSSEEEKKDLRMAMHKEKEASLQILKEQTLKQEVDSQRRLQDIVSKYEKRIGDMNDQFVREKRLRDNREKQLVKDLQRQHETEKAALQAKYEAQSRQTQLAHEREIKDTSRRQQEKLDEVLSSIKKA